MPHACLPAALPQVEPLPLVWLQESAELATDVETVAGLLGISSAEAQRLVSEHPR